MTKAHTLRTLAILATFLLLSGSAFAVGISQSGDGIAWTAEKAFAGSAVSISGPGDFHISRSFDAGAAPHISLFDKAGFYWADGQYTWQLTLHPEAKVRGEDAAGQGSVFSGPFRIENGSVILPKASRIDSDAGFTKDIQHLDDVIIDGSLCVGFDCVNGESFGFDTIRLKENNVRIKFDDTSNSGAFPFNDWQLTANDSTNGGANKFSIEDITNGRVPFTIEASAPSNSLYADDGGRIGFGTATPVVELHVVDGDTPTLRLAQDGSSGFTAQTWDLAGNETNFFVRDVTNGSKLPFRIRPGAPESSIDIASNGDVGMGTSSPDGPLDVVRTSTGGKDMLTLTNNGPSRLFIENSNVGAGWRLNADDGNDLRFAHSADTDVEFLVTEDGNLTLLGLAGGASGSAGNDLCVDANGKLCRCGSC